VSRLADAGLEVLAADQTTPEATAAGLRCVRVIVPGLIPITFGHLHRRVTGLPRLTDGPVGVPYPSKLAAGAEVGDVPHPFP
jgi:ribosomal protein S12 methylthiotransferase accessory factor